MLQRRLEKLDQLIADGQLEQAIVLGRQLREEHPACVPACLSLSEAYRQQTRFGAAKECAAQAYQLDPRNEFARAQYARTLIPFADHHEIVMLLEQHNLSAPSVAWVNEMMASAAASIDEWQLALSCYERLLRAQPGHPHALYMSGLALSVLGRRDDAIATLKQLINVCPNYGRAWWSLADLDLSAVDEKQLLAHLDNKRLSDTEKVYLWQVRGQLQQRRQEYANAFECWENANRTRRARQVDQQLLWDNLVTALLVQGEIFPESLKKRSISNGNHKSEVSAESPIFIVGLPRSGSTLIEQLISNSGHVSALGELRDLEVLLQQAMGLDPRPLPFALGPQAFDSVKPAEIGEAYVNRIRSRRAGGRFCDKNPFNFLFIGVILQAFPGARIVHVYKHPMDACLGAFKHQFAAAAPWSYSLPDIAHFYSLYHRMMGAWERLYPGRICHLSYENLLQDPVKATRRVFEYCDLVWTSKVMKLELKKGAVLSASANQVREGMHTRALYAHINFETQLEPFRQTLLDKGLKPDGIQQFEVTE